VVAPGSGEHFFDPTFTEAPPAQNEGLYAYDLMVRAPQPGITLLRAEKPDDWVLGDVGSSFTVTEATADHLSISALSNNDLYDITTGKKAARIYYGVDAGTLPGLYRITPDPSDVIFAGGNPSGRDIVVEVTDPGVVRVTPEPSGLAVLGATAAFALRRRREA
jgi:hypothetical protein